MLRPLQYLSSRAFRLLAVVVLLAVVGVVALTRTQVGRDVTARQIEQSFRDRFDGELSIGHLSGNLLQQFRASDVRVTDDSGAVILRIDSLSLEPSWSELLRKRFDARHLVLVRPELRFDVGRDGVSSLETVFATADSSADRSWSLRTLTVEIIDGTLLTTDLRERTRPSPLANWGMSNLNTRLRVDATVSPMLVDLLEGSARLPQVGTGIRSMAGQLSVDSGRIEATNAVVELDESRVAFDGAFAPGPEFELALQPSSISFDEISRLVPGVPLRGGATIRADIRGPLDGLVISRLGMEFGASSLSASGYVVGLPDSAFFEADLGGRSLRAVDLRGLLPSVEGLSRARFDSLDVTSQLQGRWSEAGWLLEGTAGLSGSGGTAELQGSITGAEAGIAESQFDVQALRLDPQALIDLGMPRASLSGSASVLTRGAAASDLVARASFDLNNLQWGRRSAGRAAGRFVINPRQATASVQVFESDGELAASLTADRTGERRFSVEIEAQQFDAGPLSGNAALVTTLNGQIGIDGLGAGTQKVRASGYARVDSGFVEVRDARSALQAQQWDVDYQTEDITSPILRVESESISAIVNGDAAPADYRLLFQAWKNGLAAGLSNELDKPYGAETGFSDDLNRSLAEAEAVLLRADVRRARGPSPVSLEIDLDVRDPLGLQAWWPTGPSWGGRFSSNLTIQASADSLRAGGRIRGDSIRVGSLSFVDPASDWLATTGFNDPLGAGLRLELSLDSSTLETPVSDLVALKVEANTSNRLSHFTLRTDAGAEIGPLDIAAQMENADDRFRVMIDRLSLAARNYAWTIVGSPSLDVYRDAVVAREVQLTSGELDGVRQLIRFNGTFSDLPGDTLSVQANHLTLLEVTRFGGIRPALAGTMDAQILMTGGWSAPQVAGNTAVESFMIGTDLIGDVAIQSSLIPGRRDINLRVDVLPSDSTRANPRPERVLPNDLTLTGTVRLPATPAAGPRDPGAWDLTLDFRHVELFFLEYIFNKAIDRAGGHLSGGGSMTGSFVEPIFDVGLDILDGDFGVPVTGAHYTAAGRLEVDREAIHIRRAEILDSQLGAADISGALLFNDYEFFSLDLSAELNELEIMNVAHSDTLPFYGFLRGSGTAYLTGPIADATLRIPNGVTRDDSQLFIPMVESFEETDNSFIIFADSTGVIPNLDALIRRANVISRRASAERKFVDGLNMDLNIFAPPGSMVHLVIDPLLGDVIRARSTGRVQLTREQGAFQASGELAVQGGDYLFTAGEVFVRRFLIEEGGTITWDGDPIDARLNIPAVYRTRASLAGLDGLGEATGALIPLVVELQISSRVLAPEVELRLAIDRTNQNVLGDYQALEARLNQPDRATEYATSVLLTNSFQLTTDNLSTASGEQLAFNSVSQLVSSQLNRFLNAALPNVDFNFGLQGERAQDLDITYGVALRLLDERLIIRGQGVYQGSRTDVTTVASESIQGEFVVEVRLNPSVSVEVFFRREGDIFQSTELTNTAGAGLSYQTEFWSWRRFLRKVFGWTFEDRAEEGDEKPTEDEPVSW